MTGIGKDAVLKMAQEKLGARAEEWLNTPNNGLEENATPATVLESDCMWCKEVVARQLEAM